VKDRNGYLLLDDTEILNRWKEYCASLYAETPESQAELDESAWTVGKEPTPVLEEVEKALKLMKAGKAPGPDELPVEILKLGEDTVTKALQSDRV